MAKAAKKPEHKPSKKVALDEVLASLQDLVQNEFADDSLALDPDSLDSNERDSSTGSSPNVLNSGSAQKVATKRKRGRPPKNNNGGQNKASLNKKNARQQSPIPSDPTEAEDYTYSQEQADLFNVASSSDDNAKQTVAGSKPRPTNRTTPRTTGRQAIPKLEIDQIPTNLKIVGNSEPATPIEEDAPKMANKSSNAAEEPAGEPGLNWASDIPVLTEVVDPAEFDAFEFQNAVNQSLENENLSPEARQIAIKVAAKLNIEMRESGGEQLDIKTIMRLQTLLKEALEPKD